MPWHQAGREGIYLLEGVEFPKAYTEDDRKQYFYLCFIEHRNGQEKWLKCGVTCNPQRRMEAHQRKYGTVKVLWFSPVFSKYTAEKIEDDFRFFGRNNPEWEWQRKDRFIIPENIKEIHICVRKTYIVPLIR